MLYHNVWVWIFTQRSHESMVGNINVQFITEISFFIFEFTPVFTGSPATSMKGSVFFNSFIFLYSLPLYACKKTANTHYLWCSSREHIHVVHVNALRFVVPCHMSIAGMGDSLNAWVHLYCCIPFVTWTLQQHSKTQLVRHVHCLSNVLTNNGGIECTVDLCFYWSTEL